MVRRVGGAPATLTGVRRLLTLVLVSLALAAGAEDARAAGRPELVVPASEDPTAWTEAASLGGFELGTRSGTPRVDITVDAAGWHVKATDAAGRVREATVPAPKDSQGREDIVWLARSLLTPASSSRWATSAPPATPRPTAALPPVVVAAAAPAPLTPVASPVPAPRPAPRPPTPAVAREPAVTPVAAAPTRPATEPAAAASPAVATSPASAAPVAGAPTPVASPTAAEATPATLPVAPAAALPSPVAPAAASPPPPAPADSSPSPVASSAPASSAPASSPPTSPAPASSTIEPAPEVAPLVASRRRKAERLPESLGESATTISVEVTPPPPLSEVGRTRPAKREAGKEPAPAPDVASRPAPRPAKPKPEPTPAAATPPGATSATPAASDDSTSGSETTRAQLPPGALYAGLSANTFYRSDIGISGAVGAELAAELGWLRVGVSGSWQPSAVLDGLGVERRTSEIHAAVDAGWHGGSRLQPAVLAELAVSRRTFAQGNLVAGRVTTPAVGVKAALGWAAVPALVVQPWADATYDLGEVLLIVDGEPSETPVGRVTARLGLTIFAHFGP